MTYATRVRSGLHAKKRNNERLRPVKTSDNQRSCPPPVKTAGRLLRLSRPPHIRWRAQRTGSNDRGRPSVSPPDDAVALAYGADPLPARSAVLRLRWRRRILDIEEG